MNSRLIAFVSAIIIPFTTIVGSNELAAASAQPSKFRIVDLSKQFKQPLSTFAKNSVWGALPQGDQSFDGVPFKLEGFIDLAGMGAARMGASHRSCALDIPAGFKANRLHLLHNTGWTDAEGAPIAKIVLHYANGEQRSIPILYGVHARCQYFSPEPTPDLKDPHSTNVLAGAKLLGGSLRLFKSTFDNPLPTEIIKTIDFVTLFGRAVPFIIAMTAEQSKSPTAAGTNQTHITGNLGVMSVQVKSADKSANIANAVVTVRGSDTNSTFNLGELISDKKGLGTLYYPFADAQDLELHAKAPGYIGVTKISKGETGFPKTFEFKLEKAASVGGLVKCDTGEPVGAAKITILDAAPVKSQRNQPTQWDEVETDSKGKWKSSSIPPGWTNLWVQIRHPDYHPMDLGIVESAAAQKTTKEELTSAKAVAVLKPGIRYTGIIVDAKNKPISEAKVSVLLDSEDNAKPHTFTTDGKGQFHFAVLKPDTLTICLQAKDFAPRLEQVEVQNSMTNSLRVDKGKPIRGQVVDADKKPVADAKVAALKWPGTSLPSWSAQTDSAGRFVWNNAPENVRFEVTKAGFVPTLTQTLSPEKENTVQLNTKSSISGKVIDAETKAPIESFNIVIGRAWSGSENISWNIREAEGGADGQYSMEPGTLLTPGLCILIYADGYLPKASPIFRDQGRHTYDFELKKGEGPHGVVRLPNGSPAEGAQVVLLTGEYVSMTSGSFKQASEEFLSITDEKGEFQLPAWLQNGRIVAAHEQGFAEMSQADLAKSGVVQLLAWGQIEGVLRIGSQPLTNTVVRVLNRPENGPSFQLDSASFTKTTDQQGKFVLSKVPPGSRNLAEIVSQDRGWGSGTPIEVKSGETTQIELGLHGRQVTGQLKLDKVIPGIDWTRSSCTLNGNIEAPKFKNAEEARKWQNSPEGKKATQSVRCFPGHVSSSGVFKINCLLPGEYNMTATLYDGSEGGGYGNMIAHGNKQVTVPESKSDSTDTTLDIGTLELKARR